MTNEPPSGSGDPAVDMLVEAGNDWLTMMRRRAEQGEARLRDLKAEGASGHRAREFELALEELNAALDALPEGGGEARRAIGRAAQRYDAAAAALDGEPSP
jgi:hypothetical protein